MIESFVLSITREALLWVLLISAPALIVALVVGVGLSVLQATTQIQDQTLTYVPKIIAVFAVMAVVGPWAMTQMIRFTAELIEKFPQMVR